MDVPPDVGRALAARTIDHSRDLDETLAAIAEAARTAVPGFDEAGISTVLGSGAVETRAATGSLVYKLDYMQYKLGEGPSVDSLRDAHVVAAARLGDDPRWPYYARAAARMGLRSQLAIRLQVDEGGTLGGLTLYSTTRDEIHHEAAVTAGLFAAHAAVALSSARASGAPFEAPDTREVIGRAVGIVMDRYRMNEDRAFAYLVRASSHGSATLREVAQGLVEQ